MTRFDQHAFISYAHIDNEPLTAGQKGWVSQFHATLQTRLSQRLGEKARIWRDDKLNGNDVFGDEIVRQFPRTALLVSIFSPRYLRSDWCTRELKEFAEAAARSGGVVFGNRSRLFKVVKTPLEPGAALPSLVERTLGYEFYLGEGEQLEEIDPAFGDKAREEFLRRVSRLAVEMAASLKELLQSAASAAAERARSVVYLAECGRDMQATRESLATDLRLHRYEVLPAQQLPLAEEALVPEVKAQLERCALAIHLVGRSVGPIPDGPAGRSLVALQNDLAVERCRAAALRRIVWLPDGLTGERPEQQSFIDSLLGDARAQHGADVLRGDIEALKGAMHQALQRLETAPESAAPQAVGKPIVHVVMTEADRAAVVPLVKLLRAHALEVTLPVFSGDAAALREANARLTAACDAVVLFYGAGDEVWKLHQANDLRKQAAAAPRERVVWTLLGPPATPDKDMLQALEEPNLIDARIGIGETAIAPLAAALRPTGPRA